MTSKRHRRWRECGRKIAYATRALAEHAQAEMLRLAGEQLVVYRCHWGDHYHVGHENHSTQRNRELFR